MTDPPVLTTPSPLYGLANPEEIWGQRES